MVLAWIIIIPGLTYLASDHSTATVGHQWLELGSIGGTLNHIPTPAILLQEGIKGGCTSLLGLEVIIMIDQEH